jgi:hypothetical protein
MADDLDPNIEPRDNPPTSIVASQGIAIRPQLLNIQKRPLLPIPSCNVLAESVTKIETKAVPGLYVIAQRKRNMKVFENSCNSIGISALALKSIAIAKAAATWQTVRLGVSVSIHPKENAETTSLILSPKRYEHFLAAPAK